MFGLSLSPEDALAQHIAIGLVVVRRRAGAQPVSLVVAAQRAPVDLALNHQGYARLARIAEEFTEGVGICMLVGERVEGESEYRHRWPWSATQFQPLDTRRASG